jgi:hypothetical protein
MFQKSTLTLIFLRFTFIHIQVVLYFLFSILRLIEYNIFHKHTLCQQHEAISHYHISHYKFYLTFRDYCGINLLLRHQYGSHYLYLNLKKLILRSSSDSGSETGSATMISSFAWLKETASHKFLLRTNLNPMDSHASARIKSWLSCVRDGFNIFSNDTFFPPTVVRLRLQNLQLSSTLDFFCCLPRFFKLFSEF